MEEKRGRRRLLDVVCRGDASVDDDDTWMELLLYEFHIGLGKGRIIVLILF